MNNIRIAASLGSFAALVIAGLAYAQPVPTPPQACQGGTGCAASACPTSITQAQATLPLAACPINGETQSAVDIFSWNEFIALNWPATTACAADQAKSILSVKSGDQGPVVWQTLMTSDDVFVAPNKTPAKWCTGSALAALFVNKPRALSHTAQTTASPHALARLASSIAQPTDVNAVGGVVTDQSGRWLRYERLMDQSEYGAIVGSNWYRRSVLDKLKSITLPTGSLELKSAWKILTPAEIAGGRYYTTTATVYNTPEMAKSPGKNPVTLGLVGLHIIQKTAEQSGFFWSTFEQVDNESVFFNPGSNTAINKQTAKKPFTELKSNGAPINLPVQIKRDTPIAANPGLNAYYQNLLAGSVFANYRLISTQWQTGLSLQGTPAHVANIVIETYVQLITSKPPNPSTGCLACHKGATAANGKTLTDHSFLFLEAK
ncbi:MAG: hypothetical protein WAM62_10650 [Pseudolabrys sp.]